MLGKKKDNNPNSDNNHDDDKHVSSNSASENGRRQQEKEEEDERNKSLSKGTKFVASNEAKYIIIGVAAVAIFWFGLKAVLQVNNPFYVVSSESMVPTLTAGDLVVLRYGNNGSGSSFHDLQFGDIIVFHSEDGGGRTIVHRIVEIYTEDANNNSDNNRAIEEGEERVVKTKGDNNPVSYEGLDYPIREDDYYGKVISVIPKVGLVTMPPYNYIIAGIAVGLVSVTGIVAYIMYQKENKKKDKK